MVSAVSALVAVLAGGVRADERAQFGDVAATALEGVMVKVLAGSSIEWTSTPRVLRADGSAEAFFLPGFQQRRESAGFLFLTGLEFPESRDRLKKGILDLRADAGRAVTQIIAFRSDALGRVTGYKEGVLDSSAQLTESLDIALEGRVQAGVWPLVRVQYRSFHGTADWTGAVELVSQIDTANMATRERIPTWVRKRLRSGSVSDEPVTAESGGNGTIQVKGVRSGKIVQYYCGEPCVVDGRAVLDAW